MKFENLNFEILDSNVGVLTVNRPKALNALNSLVIKELADFFREVTNRKDIKALILTGNGDKAFIAGADIAEMSKLSKADALSFARSGQVVSKLMQDLPFPVIAAVNGYALGGGCEMAISCDFIIASEKAVFGQPEVSLGLITGFGGAVRLAEFVGWPMAKELIYTGKRIDAQEAYRIGLANKVVSQETLMTEALSIAKKIAENSSLAVATVKRAMSEINSVSDLSERLEIEATAFSSVFDSYDQKEGTSAFVEKRKPAFKGA